MRHKIRHIVEQRDTENDANWLTDLVPGSVLATRSLLKRDSLAQ